MFIELLLDLYNYIKIFYTNIIKYFYGSYKMESDNEELSEELLNRILGGPDYVKNNTNNHHYHKLEDSDEHV
tara:strand:- start:3321 stop:3536 length:216 start_codon:yes stop_codon:yes gene_type:complete